MTPGNKKKIILVEVATNSSAKAPNIDPNLLIRSWKFKVLMLGILKKGPERSLDGNVEIALKRAHGSQDQKKGLFLFMYLWQLGQSLRLEQERRREGRERRGSEEQRETTLRGQTGVQYYI